MVFRRRRHPPEVDDDDLMNDLMAQLDSRDGTVRAESAAVLQDMTLEKDIVKKRSLKGSAPRTGSKSDRLVLSSHLPHQLTMHARQGRRLLCRMLSHRMIQRHLDN